LQSRLKECIQQQVPVSTTAVERDESMRGLDVTAKWKLLTPNPTPISEPTNEDSNLRPPTEREGGYNRKYGYDERFDRMPFTGTTEKMQYKYGKKSRKRKNGKGNRKLSPTRQQKDPPIVEERVKGGPNEDFLKKHGLDENSHPMDWRTNTAAFLVVKVMY